MNESRRKAYAKINLTLDILGTQGGYHMIDSLVATVDLADSVRVRKRKDGAVNVSMSGLGSDALPPEENNAYKAAKLFTEKFGCPGADIRIDKNIPMGAGLGGSSADAAAVLNALSDIYGGTYDEIKEIADMCGSDTGYMLTGGFAEITGRGENVRRVYSSLRPYVLLCLPRFSVSTGMCYGKYDELNVRMRPKTQEALEALERGDIRALGKSLGNALFSPARVIRPDIATLYGALLDTGPCGVNMTGSGSCVYALCENDAFCRYTASRLKGPWRTVQAKVCQGDDKWTEE